MTIGAPWRWTACTVDARDRLWRTYTVAITVIAPYSTIHAAGCFYETVVAASDRPGTVQSAHLDYNDSDWIKIPCQRPLGTPGDGYCLRWPGHPGDCSPTTETDTDPA